MPWLVDRSPWPISFRRRRAAPALFALGLAALLVSCGTDEPTMNSDNDAENDTANAGDSDARFPADEMIGPMRLHVPEDWEEFPVESSDEGEITGFSEAQDGTAEGYVMTRTDFQGARNVASANGVMSAEVQFRGGEQEEPQQIELEGADVAWSADLTWPGDRGEVIGRYWVAQDEESGVMAAVEYGGYGVEQEELDAYGETLELVPEAGE